MLKMRINYWCQQLTLSYTISQLTVLKLLWHYMVLFTVFTVLYQSPFWGGYMFSLQFCNFWLGRAGYTLNYSSVISWSLSDRARVWDGLRQMDPVTHISYQHLRSPVNSFLTMTICVEVMEDRSTQTSPGIQDWASMLSNVGGLDTEVGNLNHIGSGSVCLQASQGSPVVHSNLAAPLGSAATSGWLEVGAIIAWASWGLGLLPRSVVSSAGVRDSMGSLSAD